MLIPLLSAMAPVAPGLAARLAARALFRPGGRRSSPRGDAFLASGRRQERRIDGQRIVTWRWTGERSTGSLVLCLHGWAGSAAQFAVIAPALLARGLSVLAIDGPGHGRSSGRESSIPALRDVVVEIARGERQPLSMVAHSGGAVAVTLAIAAGVEAVRLAFVGPTVDPGALLEQSARSAGFSERLLSGVKRHTEARFGMPWTGLRVLPIAATRREPLLIVHDRDDEEVPWGEGANLAAAWPGARMLTTDGLGHRRILYDPIVAERVAGFVAGGDL